MPFNGDDRKDELLSEADPIMFEDSECECGNTDTFNLLNKSNAYGLLEERYVVTFGQKNIKDSRKRHSLDIDECEHLTQHAM